MHLLNCSVFPYSLIMALNITEFQSLIGSGNFQIEVPMLSAAISQNVAVSGTSAQSTALDPDTRFVLLVAGEDCRIVADENPTALSTSTLLLAGVPIYFGIDSAHKIAVIAA